MMHAIQKQDTYTTRSSTKLARAIPVGRGCKTLLRRKTEVTVTVPPTAEPVLVCYQRERKATEENVAKRFGFVFSAKRTEPEENVVRECVVSHQPPFARPNERERKRT